MKTIYTAYATTTQGREGHSQTDDKNLSVTLSKPGSNKAGTNPEQLFAMGYSACFGSAIEAVAKKQNISIADIKVQAEITLNQDEISGYSLGATLNVNLLEIENAIAQKIVQDAHQMCPYSKAIRGNIDVILTVNGDKIGT